MINYSPVLSLAAWIMDVTASHCCDLLQLFQWNLHVVFIAALRCYCSIEAALSVFTQMRPPGIYKQDYLSELFTRYGEREDTPLAPPFPAWYLGQYSQCVAASY